MTRRHERRIPREKYSGIPTLKHPRQPVFFDDEGTIRFKPNEIVEYLLNLGSDVGTNLNTLATIDFPQEDREQFAQLIAYSVSGFGDLSYASKEVVDAADRDAEALEIRTKSPDPEALEIQRIIDRVLDDLRLLDDWLIEHSAPIEAKMPTKDRPDRSLAATYIPRQWVGGVQHPSVSVSSKGMGGHLTTREALASVVRFLNCIKEAER